MIITRAIREVRDRFREHSPRIVDTLYYGATYLDPVHLAIWYIVQTNADLAKAKANGLEHELAGATRVALASRGYATAALPAIHVNVESQERIEASGGWRLHFA